MDQRSEDDTLFLAYVSLVELRGWALMRAADDNDDRFWQMVMSADHAIELLEVSLEGRIDRGNIIDLFGGDHAGATQAEPTAIVSTGPGNQAPLAGED